MKTPVFTGTCTALITPFQASGSIDYAAFARQMDRQLESGVDALCVCGTTGESSTLTVQEHVHLVDYCVSHVAGRCKVVAGSGSNDTAAALYLCQHAQESGADALLLVTPYYNKTTQTGLIHHYEYLADKTDLPVILYNVPSRTGCNLLPATCAALADHPRIAAVKEASGNIGQIVEVAALAGDRLAIYSGNDDHIVPVLSMGGSGCISVLSNVVPREAQALCRRFFAGDVAGAAALQCKLLPLVNALFSEVNPIPVNAALAAMGFGKGGVRLPLTPMEESRRAALLAEMKRLGVLA